MGLGEYVCIRPPLSRHEVAHPQATGLILSCRPEDRNHKLGVCQGCPKHRLVEGRLKDGRNVSEHVAEYTSKFVKSIMDLCVPDLPELNTRQIDLAALFLHSPIAKSSPLNRLQPTTRRVNQKRASKSNKL